LREAFLLESDLKAHPITGEVRVGGILFLVPKERLFKGRRVRIGLDPEAAHAPFLVLGLGLYEPLLPAFAPPATRPVSDQAPDPIGPLTPLLEQYRGRTLPQARGGFGLPEIYDAFAQALGRPVPHTEAEAVLVLEWFARCGPFEPQAFAAVLAKVRATLGAGRPLAQIISALDRRIVRQQPKEDCPCRARVSL
jgi:hypothetical protein